MGPRTVSHRALQQLRSCMQSGAARCRALYMWDALPSTARGARAAHLSRPLPPMTPALPAGLLPSRQVCTAKADYEAMLALGGNETLASVAATVAVGAGTSQEAAKREVGPGGKGKRGVNCVEHG